jgi:hypothetical protein
LDREEDAAAVKMYLGMRITKDGELEPLTWMNEWMDRWDGVGSDGMKVVRKMRLNE